MQILISKMLFSMDKYVTFFWNQNNVYNSQQEHVYNKTIK